MGAGAKKRPKPKPHKTIIIYEGNRPCVVAFIDQAKEQKILAIIDEGRHIAH